MGSDDGDGKDAPQRACDGCRRMKIRCIGKEKPPCKRCANMKLECRFEMGGVPRMGPEEFDSFSRATKSRLESLEGQVGGINGKLDDISAFLRNMQRTPITASPLTAYTHISDHPVGRPESWPTLDERAPSPAKSASDDEDPMDLATAEPFRDLTRREEAERLRADGYDAGGRWDGNTRKRRRVEDAVPAVRAHGGVWYSADPVTLGWCAEAEGRELFQAFFDYAYPFLPVLDPKEDTWADVRARSPFLTTVLLYVSSRARDGCARASDLTRKCREQAENMAKATVFSPIATLETVQSLTILSLYTAHGWRASCHALSLAVDMRLFLCLAHLRDQGGDTERQRALIAGARVWLALVKQSYEMSYNHALPLQFPVGETMKHARAYVAHPMMNIWDARTVVALELLVVREPLFHPGSGGPSGPELDEMLREANAKVAEVYEHWLEYYHRAGLPSDHYLLRELRSQRAYCVMYANAPAWQGIKTPEDVALLPRERQGWLTAAVRAGAYLIANIGAGEQAKDSEYANHSFHAGIIATARYLIRMVEVFPACDVYQVSLDLDKLLIKLPQYPSHPFTGILRRAVERARASGVLPTTNISADAAAAVPPPAESSPLLEQWVTGFSTLPWTDQPTVQENSVVWPEDLSILANWFAGMDGTPAPEGDLGNWLPGT
ncbi:hypothetical protein CcaverHIS002_0203820 [Cutaneotrichosporon cavernicola]|uniref:Zn(2)-C6 fungal-type domain-containing protein n=1 Tax=Cutaneotrichosporon cavernicola TaxID=279322 RepID=A0AA48L1J0_9TREE|nr:uncharacterized protein CcaverHIS019_0203790 [Cutaneotrichosporon cavernicola]BEI81222.1 hypothetical protein CcaverHIS002_0203820 [Cutaneotrichosporon cavernicola]BEI89017.1 hypothetical protein CcaverHIS019_0203790 [Cutaneotrichosporon cavernicola]